MRRAGVTFERGAEPPPFPAHRAGSGAGVRRWPRVVFVALALLALPCVASPIMVSRWRARERLRQGDACGPRSVLLGDPLDVAREELEAGPTPTGRASAAYALRVCRPADAPLSPDDVRRLKAAARSDPDANVRLAALDTLLAVEGGRAVGEECLRALATDETPVDLDLHGASEQVTRLRDVCAHGHTGQCRLSHYVTCVLLPPARE